MCHCTNHKKRQFKYLIMRWVKPTKHIHCLSICKFYVVKLVVTRDYLVMFREENLIQQ